MLDRKKCTLKDVQSLLGLLNFACTVVIPGRAFLQRFYGLTIGISKPYYYIRITSSARKDMALWLEFIKNFNGISLYREEMFFSKEVIDIFTDASKSRGCSAVYGLKWFSLAWPSAWWSKQNIHFLELIPFHLA